MKNFVFDLYGTLIDIQTDESSPQFRKRIEEEFFSLCGGRCDFWTEYARLCAPPADDKYYEPDLLQVFSLLAKECGADLKPAALARFAYRFRVLSRSKLALYPEVTDILRGLKSAGAGIYLLSNAQACFTVREIREVGLDKYFDGILLSSDAGVKKPSVKFFNKLIEKYGLNKRETVYTGNDYYSDVLGALGAGLFSVYIRTYNEAPLELVRKSANIVAEDYATLKKELMKLVDKTV